MSNGSMGRAVWGIAPLLGAIACSGTVLHDVGDIHSGGRAGANQGGAQDSGGASAGGRAAGEAGEAGAFVAPGGTGGGENGGGSGGGIVEVEAGAAGQGDAPLLCPTCSVVVEDQDVRGVSVSGQRVYWTDYGTTDHLGNYAADGRVLTRDVAGGPVNVVAEGLPGPEEVSVNGEYTYVLVDKRTQPKLPQGVLRIPLAGGTPEELSTSAGTDFVVAPRLIAVPGFQYWVVGGAVYRSANAANAAPETVLTARGVEKIVSDGSTLFFQDSNGVWSVPLTGGEPTELHAFEGMYSSDGYNLAVAGSFLYSLGIPAHPTTDHDYYLVRMPKTGGAWTRLVASDPSWSQLAVDGDRYYAGAFLPSGQTFELTQSSLASPSTRKPLLSYTATRTWSWAVSSVGIFYGNDQGLYLTPPAP